MLEIDINSKRIDDQQQQHHQRIGAGESSINIKASGNSIGNAVKIQINTQHSNKNKSLRVGNSKNTMTLLFMLMISMMYFYHNVNQWLYGMNHNNRYLPPIIETTSIQTIIITKDSIHKTLSPTSTVTTTTQPLLLQQQHKEARKNKEQAIMEHIPEPKQSLVIVSDTPSTTTASFSNSFLLNENKKEEKNYEPPHLRIIILTYDRYRSLHRLFKSLEKAEYLGDRVDIDIFIDYNPTSEYHIDDNVLEISNLFVNRWKYGKVKIHQRPTNYGLARQWLESWQDSLPFNVTLGDDPRERALILEDDIELSPFFYSWLKAAYEKYQPRSDVAGFSLQRLHMCPTPCIYLNGGPTNATINFLSPLVGTWGYAPIASFWAEFVDWTKGQMKIGAKPYVKYATKVTGWYKDFEKIRRCPGPKCMWSIWHMKWVETRSNKRVFTVYNRAPNGTTLAMNHMEPGVHYPDKNQPDFPLLRDKTLFNNILDFSDTPTILNWAGQIIHNTTNLDSIFDRNAPGFT